MEITLPFVFCLNCARPAIVFVIFVLLCLFCLLERRIFHLFDARKKASAKVSLLRQVYTSSSDYTHFISATILIFGCRGRGLLHSLADFSNLTDKTVFAFQVILVTSHMHITSRGQSLLSPPEPTARTEKSKG